MNPETKPIETPAPRRRRVWLWILGILTIVFIVVPIGSWIVVSSMIERRLAQAIAEANRDDPNWQINDLMAHREVVPDAENSAIIVAQVVESLPEDWPSLPNGPKGRLTHVPGSEVYDAYEDLSRTPNNVRLDNKVVEILRVELARYEKEVRLARTVAGFRRGRHELTIGPTLIDTPLRDTQLARNAARLLRADAAIRTHVGDFDGAIESSRAILGVGRSIGDEPFIISQLVRIALGSLAMNSARSVLGQAEPSIEALARLQADFEDERKQPLTLRAMRGERSTLTELIRRVSTGEVSIDALTGSNPTMTHDPLKPRKIIAPWAKVMLENQRAIAIEWMNRAVENAKRSMPERAALYAELEAEQTRVRKSTLGPYTATLPILLISSLNAGVKAQTRYEAELGAIILLLAAERQRRQTGQWPITPAAIDRAILPEPPLDPANGKPYQWKLGEGKIVIYSLGGNLKDEGGLYDPKKWVTGVSDDVGATGWDPDQRNRAGQ